MITGFSSRGSGCRPAAMGRASGTACRSTTRGGSRRASLRLRPRRACPTSPWGDRSGRRGSQCRHGAGSSGPASRGPCQNASAMAVAAAAATASQSRSPISPTQTSTIATAAASGTRDSEGISSAAAGSPSSGIVAGVWCPSGRTRSLGPGDPVPRGIGASDDRDPVEVVRRRRRGRRPLEGVSEPRIGAGRLAEQPRAAPCLRGSRGSRARARPRRSTRAGCRRSSPSRRGTCRPGAASRAGRAICIGKNVRLKPTKTSQKLAWPSARRASAR